MLDNLLHIPVHQYDDNPILHVRPRWPSLPRFRQRWVKYPWDKANLWLCKTLFLA